MDSFAAGAAAGLVVDLTLYPIDTIKTRVQSKCGFHASGGFRHVYKGLSAVVVGSVPGGAAFFFTYDTVKQHLLRTTRCRDDMDASANVTTTGAHEAAAAAAARMHGTDTDGDVACRATSARALTCQAVAAMCGETAACCVRVPVEMVKQRMQAGYHHSIMDALRTITAARPATTATTSTAAATAAATATAATTSHTCGNAVRVSWVSGVRRLFAGMPIMLLREWPFSVTQMTLYELLKRRVHDDARLQPYTYALLPLCGAVSGGCAAFVTTPLDVVKTRVMLMQHHHHHDHYDVPCEAPQRRTCMAAGHATRVRALALLGRVVRDVAAEPARVGDVFGVTQKFFRGATARVAWISLGGSIFFSTYEAVKSGTRAVLSTSPGTAYA